MASEFVEKLVIFGVAKSGPAAVFSLGADDMALEGEEE